VKGEVPHSASPGDQAARLDQEGYLGSESQTEGSSARENLLLWIGLLGPAAVWLIELQTSYSLVPWACVSGKMWVLHLVSAICLLLAVMPGWFAWNCWRAAGQNTEVDTAGHGRRRFMALRGLMSAGLFVLLILAQEVPRFYINPCVE
jgi:hypothetical protein